MLTRVAQFVIFLPSSRKATIFLLERTRNCRRTFGGPLDPLNTNFSPSWQGSANRSMKSQLTPLVTFLGRESFDVFELNFAFLVKLWFALFLLVPRELIFLLTFLLIFLIFLCPFLILDDLRFKFFLLFALFLFSLAILFPFLPASLTFRPMFLLSISPVSDWVAKLAGMVTMTRRMQRKGSRRRIVVVWMMV